MNEQLHFGVRAFLDVDGVLNEAGIARLSEINPVHSTAGHAVTRPSNEGCHSSSTILDAVPYILEVKRNEGGKEAIALITSEFRGYSFTISVGGSIRWAEKLDNSVLKNPAFEQASRLLLRVS